MGLFRNFYNIITSSFSPVPKPLFVSITVLGVSATVTQILILREFLSVFYGNELIIGIILANWLFLTGVGTLLGKKAENISSPLRFLSWAQLAIAVLPVLSVATVRLSKTILFPPGEMVGLVSIYLLSTFILAPYCVLSGFLHPLACVLFSRPGEENRIGEVYFLDVLGDIAGGLLFSFVLVFLFPSLTITFILLMMNVAAMGWLLIRGFPQNSRTKPQAFTAVFLLTIATGLFMFGDLNRWTVQRMFPKQELLSSTETPYGFLTATKTKDQLNIFQNGFPVYSSRVSVQAEENVHYTMLQHPSPKKILLVSGGTGPTFQEINKYRGAVVDYVELDPKVVEWNRKYGGLKDFPHVRIIHKDGRRFIKQTDERYDVVLLCLPEPNTAALNRYFTVEFYEEVRKILTGKGVLGFGVVPMSNYFNRETRKLLSSQFKTLKKVFPHVAFIPGSRVFFVAGETSVTSNITALLKKRPEMKGHFLTPEVLQGFITPDRIATVREAVREEVGENRDFSPTAYHYQLLLWVKLFQEKAVWLVIGLGILLVLFMARLGPETFVMFSSGFSGSCLSVVLILMFQAIHGVVYYMLGVLVTAFMAGMALGTLRGNLIVSAQGGRKVLFPLEWGILAYALCLPFVMEIFKEIGSPALQSVATTIGIPLCLTALGVMVGMEFSVISRMIKEKVADAAGQIYSADYFGAAFGAILTSVLLVPLLGFYGVSIAVALLHLVSLFVLAKGARRIPLSEAAAIVLYIGFFGWLVLGENTGENTYVLSYHPIYVWAVVLSMLIISCVILFWRDRYRKFFTKRSFRILSIIGFVPLIFFPIFKCWFIIPYLYCHVCPRKCIFGYIRPFTAPLACLQNLQYHFWCYQICPVGILQDAQCKKSRQMIPTEIKNMIRFGILALFILTYFWVEKSRRVPEMGPGTDLFLVLFTNEYAFSVSIFTGAVIILLVSFWIKRFFCDYLCPIGSFAALVVRLDQTVARKWAWWKGYL